VLVDDGPPCAAAESVRASWISNSLLSRAHESSCDASLPGLTSCRYDIPEVVLRPWRTCRATLERYSDRHRGLIWQIRLRSKRSPSGRSACGASGLHRADPLAEQAVYIGQIRLRSKRSPLEQAVSFRTPGGVRHMTATAVPNRIGTGQDPFPEILPRGDFGREPLPASKRELRASAVVHGRACSIGSRLGLQSRARRRTA
jgi:hypothetical protein